MFIPVGLEELPGSRDTSINNNPELLRRQKEREGGVFLSFGYF